MPRHWEVEGNGRYCAECGLFHGIYFRCESYPEEVLEEIARGETRFRENLKKETDPVVRGIFEVFMGEEN